MEILNERKYSVYRFIFFDRKQYFGSTKNIKHRWRDNGKAYKSQAVYEAIQHDGWDNITKDVIADHLSKEGKNVLIMINNGGRIIGRNTMLIIGSIIRSINEINTIKETAKIGFDNQCVKK